MRFSLILIAALITSELHAQQGRNRSEIAKELNLSRQLIHRILKLVQDRLTHRFERISSLDSPKSTKKADSS